MTSKLCETYYFYLKMKFFGEYGFGCHPHRAQPCACLKYGEGAAVYYLVPATDYLTEAATVRGNTDRIRISFRCHSTPCSTMLGTLSSLHHAPRWADPHGKPSTERGAVRGMHRQTPARQTQSRFSWAMLNVTTAACGNAKCYFSSQRRKNEGWLVGGVEKAQTLASVLAFGMKVPDLNAWFAQWSRTWTFAEKLRKDFGVEHLLLGPPLIATLTPEQAVSLNSKLKRLHLKSRPIWPHRALHNITPREVKGVQHSGAPQYYTAGPHPVQAVRSCVWPACIAFGCAASLAASFQRRVIGFIEHAPNRLKLSEGIERNLALVATMAKAHPALKYDFQVFLRNDGTVINIDLDRCDQFELGVYTNLSKLAQLPGLCEDTETHQLCFDKMLKELHRRLRQKVALRRPPQFGCETTLQIDARQRREAKSHARQNSERLSGIST